MSEEDRSDYAIQPGKPTTLPPAAKISREVLHGLRDILIPLMCLVAARWGLVSGEIFAGAVFIVLGGNMALRRGEHKDG
jgi:hypothetical protein